MESFTLVSSPPLAEWNRFVEQHPKGSIFHTPEMVQVFHATKKYAPFVCAALNTSGEMIALLVAARVQTLPDPLSSLGSRSIWYAEPLCSQDTLGVQALAALIAEHDKVMRNRVLFTEIRPLYAPGCEQKTLQSCDYKYEEYLNFVVDLKRSDTELWQNLSNTCRANIRRGIKHGVKIEEVTDASSVDLLYEFLQMTYERARVPLADKSLFTAAWQILAPLNRTKIFVAYRETEPIGAAIVLLYKKTVFEWYWGVKIIQSVYPAESITWHRIKWGQENSYDIYDFGGAGWPNKPYGVRDFKAKFGGQLVNFGRYRKIYSSWKFTSAEKGYDLVRKILTSSNWR